MNDELRSHIRKSAARRFYGVSIALGLAVILILGARVAQDRIAQNYGRATLARESSALTREYTRFEAKRGKELALFPPPADASRQEIWARRISDEFDQPAAVCLIDRPALMWIRKPQEFATTADSIAHWLTSPDASSRQATLHRLGDTQVLHTRFQSGSDIHNLWLFNRGQDSLNWGVLLSSNATWIAFFRDIQQSAADDPDVGSPAWALQDLFSLPKSPTRQWNMGVRAFLNDSLIYASKDLDTTRLSYAYDFKGRRAECYLSRWQEVSTGLRIMRLAFGPALLLPFALFFLFFRDYHQIRFLTKPSSAEHAHE